MGDDQMASGVFIGNYYTYTTSTIIAVYRYSIFEQDFLMIVSGQCHVGPIVIPDKLLNEVTQVEKVEQVIEAALEDEGDSI